MSLLLGTIIRKIPLPSCNSSSSLGPGDLCETSDMNPTTVCDTMLDLKQLETIGNHFLEVLLKMKHNGAIDKTRAGFTALCNRLLCSNDPMYVSIHALFKHNRLVIHEIRDLIFGPLVGPCALVFETIHKSLLRYCHNMIGLLFLRIIPTFQNGHEFKPLSF